MLYAKKNMDEYQRLLVDFRNYLAQHNVKALVVMTPSASYSSCKERFDVVKPLLLNAGFGHITEKWLVKFAESQAG